MLSRSGEILATYDESSTLPQGQTGKALGSLRHGDFETDYSVGTRAWDVMCFTENKNYRPPCSVG